MKNSYENDLNFIDIEVAYAAGKEEIKQLSVFLKLQQNDTTSITIKEIIELSGVLNLFPEINLKINKVGIFGKIYTLDSKNIRDGDRIEIYRKLLKAPNETRTSLIID